MLFFTKIRLRRLTKDGLSGSNNFRKQYENRPALFKDYSLYDYFLRMRQEGKRLKIPHFTGTYCKPVFPATERFAQAMLTIYKPWSRGRPIDKKNLIIQFHNFLKEISCPISIRIPYERAKERVLSKLQEPTSVSEPVSIIDETCDIPDDVKDAVQLWSVIGKPVIDPLERYAYDFGENFNWAVPRVGLESKKVEDVSKWLESKIQESNNRRNPIELQLPTRTVNGRPKNYELNDLAPDQKNVAFEVLRKIMEWTEIVGNEEKMRSFKPLFLTVRGKAGSGKSTLIHTLTTIVRRKFNCNECCENFAPTGCAAFAIGGRTGHSRFGVNVIRPTTRMSAQKKRRLMVLNQRLIMLIGDERSLIAASLLGCIEHTCRLTAHHGQNSNKPWGGIPVVILMGDDGQLPSVNKGAFAAINPPPNSSIIEHQGFEVFKIMGRNVRDLSTLKRQDESQAQFRRILDGLYNGNIKQNDIMFLLKHHIDNEKNGFTKEEVENIKSKSLYIFAKKRDRDVHNDKQLYVNHSKHNPVARIRSQDSITNKSSSHFDDQVIPKITKFCVNSMVSLTGRNLKPEWGLYNQAIGIVKDIVFLPSQSPENRDLPAFVLVDFQHYVGPAFIAKKPTYVPIAPITVRCDYGCCERTQIPLNLSFGKTMHTFQGMSVGPTPCDKPDNSIQCIICDPGDKSFEGRTAVGMTYSLCSRSTQLMQNNDKTSSALYFTGQNMTYGRIANLFIGRDGRKFKKILDRERWVAYLKKHKKNVTISEYEKRKIKKWLSRNTMTPVGLDTIIRQWNTV